MSPLYYKEPDVTVSWDSLNKWVVAQWRNSPSPQTVRKGCTEILNLLRFQQATAVLNDNTEVTGTWVGASTWVADEWFPLLIGSGLRRFAWVRSPVSPVSVISARKSAGRNRGVIRLFDDTTDAERWLREGAAEAEQFAQPKTITA